MGDPPRILVVEDESVIALYLQSQLTALGYRVVGVIDDGETAVARAAALRPDLVLMDIRLNGEMDGVEAARQMNARGCVAVVFLTAFAEDETLQRAQAVVPAAYLVKPFEIRELHATVQMALARGRERALEERLRQAQRLETVGQLTGGVAHDFNNLLTVILGNAEALVEQLAEQPRQREMADMVLTAARGGANLTRRLLAFAREQKLDARAVDCAALVSNMEPLLRRTLSEAISIVTVAGEDLKPAFVDPSQLENAIMNLCLNARDAMPDGGAISIGIDAVSIGHGEASAHPGVSVGDFVLLSVTDTGRGISQDDQKHVFEPFFTTKEFGKGTGLGLSIVFGFVKQSKGHVSIESTVGRGTSVTLYLPVATAEQSRRTSTESVNPSQVGAAVACAETVLLVEDEEQLRIYAESALKSLGYQVITAASGSAALELVRQNAAFDLLFTDVIMPGGLNGADLAKAVRLLRPSVPVLFTSGYTENVALTSCSSDQSQQFLAKPYRRAELAMKLRSALEASQS